jgi:hypothetical protein
MAAHPMQPLAREGLFISGASVRLGAGLKIQVLLAVSSLS